MKTKVKLTASFCIVLAVLTALAAFVMPTDAFAKKSKTSFKLSAKSISISKDKDITLTSDKKNEKITVTVQKPDIAGATQKSQRGKKTVFTISPKMKGTTNIIFRAGHKTDKLKVTVTKTSIETIKNGFTVKMFLDSDQGTNASVRLMVHNHTGLKAYFSPNADLHGDYDYLGHWFDPNADASSQSVVNYATIGENEDRQIEYYNAPVYGLRYDQSFNIMTFHNQAYTTVKVFFDEPTPDNAYTLTVDTNGNTTLVKA